ncbi:MAG: exosortase/archaeosortase family protein [Bacteroides sp.]|jgi:exosortase/archaeosortase family protein|nr:exosortase/archaeosortase family protein [Bacteroides sp.]
MLPKHLHPLKDILLFLALLFSFHFIYLGWSQGLEFWLIERQVLGLFEWVANGLLKQSVWVLQALGVDVVLVDQTIYANNYEAYVSVVPECTTLKQWMHWIVIMVFFPGPWKHKLWYIPLGIMVIHLINIVRITGLTLIQFPFPNGFHFFHDYFFKTLFYAVIFLMWAFWNEKVRSKK